LSASDETHAGDLVIGEGQELMIRNRILEIDGNLIAKSRSTLRIENSTVIIVERFKSEHWIEVTGGRVEIIGSEVRPTAEVVTERYGMLATQLLLTLNQGADLTARNSTLYCRVNLLRPARGSTPSSATIVSSTVSFVNWATDSRVEITDSRVGTFIFDLRITEPEKLTFSSLQTNRTVDFFSFATSEGGSVKMKNSTVIHQWQFNMDWNCRKEVTITDSGIINMMIKFPPTDDRITISDLPDGYVENFALSDHVKGIHLPYDVTLVNSTGSFKPELLGTIAEIVDSTAMVHPHDQADVIVRNSTVNTFHDYGAKRVEFIDSELTGIFQLLYKSEWPKGYEVAGRILGLGGRFHLVFGNSRIDSTDIVVACEGGEIEGDVQIVSPKTLEDVHWVSGIVTRQYPLVVKDDAGGHLSNVSVSLFDQSGALVWSNTTDHEGKAQFGITFTPQNYTKEFDLKLENSSTSVKVGFLTSTPIVFGAAGASGLVIESGGVFYDPEGDWPSRTLDLKSVGVSRDGDDLLIFIGFWTEKPTSDVVINLDADADGLGEYHIRTSAPNRGDTFLAKCVDDSHEYMRSLLSTYDQEVVVRVPLNLIGYPEKLGLQVASWDDERNATADDTGDFEWRTWVYFEIPTSGASSTATWTASFPISSAAQSNLIQSNSGTVAVSVALMIFAIAVAFVVGKLRRKKR
jgi:hypothetical protein